uniref:Phage protein n=1 Tax=Elaeophora elaphi TaxID=1147741 RepID=A0A0R3RP12_9BILA
MGLNVTTMAECDVWNVSMLINITDISADQVNATNNDPSWTTSGVEIVTTKERLKELKLNEDLLDEYKV